MTGRRPYKRSYRRFASSRNLAYRSSNTPYSSRPLMAGGLARGPMASQWATLGYNEQFVGQPTGGSTDGYSFRLNGMFDPRVQSGGHQPQYYDQLTALYAYWCVTQVDITLRAVVDPNPTTAGTSTYGTLYQQLAVIAPWGAAAASIPSSASSDMMEWPGTQAKPMGENSAAVVKLSIDVAKVFGISRKAMLDNPTFWGTAGVDPTTQTFAFVGVGASGGGTARPTQCQAEITYRAKFWGLKTVTVS